MPLSHLLHKTVHHVVSSAAHRVALQLPDGLLMYALPVVDILRSSSATAEDVVVLANLDDNLCFEYQLPAEDLFSLIDSHAAVLHLLHHYAPLPNPVGFSKLVQWLVSFGLFVLLYERVGPLSLPIFTVPALLAYIAGSLLRHSLSLLFAGIHPIAVSDSLRRCHRATLFFPASASPHPLSESISLTLSQIHASNPNPSGVHIRCSSLDVVITLALPAAPGFPDWRSLPRLRTSLKLPLATVSLGFKSTDVLPLSTHQLRKNRSSHKSSSTAASSVSDFPAGFQAPAALPRAPLILPATPFGPHPPARSCGFRQPPPA